MSQIFPPISNTIARISLLVGLLLVTFLLVAIIIYDRSPYNSAAQAGIAVAQPVRFSHELHSNVLNIECVYCHLGAEKDAYGGIPDVHTCMSCHSQIATYSELLAPVRESYATDDPIEWNKVHDLAEHVHFNHSVHIANGFACETCHGNVEEMPLVWQAKQMTMGWCLTCHQEPERFIRPREEIYTFGYEPPIPQEELGPRLVEEYGIETEGLMTCAICHH
jgi:hypothetical protein